MAIRSFRFLRQLLDVAVASPADGEVLTYDSVSGKWVNEAGGAGGGAPTSADYLVGTANGSLSAEIVVGTSPGGELGGTWGFPTVDATHSGSSHAGVQAAAEATAAAALAAHLSDSSDAHDASAISFVAGGTIAGTDAQTAIAEVATDAASALSAHEADTTAVHGIADTSALALSSAVVAKSLYDANTVLAADSDNTPAALTMGAATILARLAAGNIKAATIQEILALASGTSFPGSPANNDLFYRTDRSLLYFYNGTRWLTTEQFHGLPNAASADAPVPTSGTGLNPWRWVDEFAFDVYIEKVEILTYHGNLTGSNYYTVNVLPVKADNTDLTELGSFNTASDTTITWTKHTITVNALLDALAVQVMVRQTKTGTPGALYTLPRFVYRMVG